MYGVMVFRPALKVQPMTSMSVQVEWNEFKFNPNYYVRSGGVYVAYTVSVKMDQAGILGFKFNEIEVSSVKTKFLLEICFSFNYFI